VKDVGMFGRDMRRTLLIDNNPYAMLPQPDNAFPILSWFDDDDRELDTVFELLMKMKSMRDVRPLLKKQFSYRVS
jgi:TFIIF-interacting CTD phosphatase-like protein